MKRIVFPLLVLVLTLSLFSPSAATAQTAVNATWTSGIVYYNPTDTGGGSLSVNYLNGDTGASVGSNNAAIEGHQSGELLIGDAGSVPADFRGSAVVSSDVPLVAVYRQFIAADQADKNYSPVLYTAFDSTQGSLKYYVPTFNRSPGFKSLVGVQNVTGGQVQVLLHIINAADGTDITWPNDGTKHLLNANQTWIVDSNADNLKDLLGRNFNGSIWVEATGNVVVAAQEQEQTGRRAYAFEGIPVEQAGAQVFMASAMCRYGKTLQTSYYALQNVGAVSADIYVNYYDANGKLLNRTPLKAASNVPVYGKASINTCSTRTLSGKTGSAKFWAVSGGTGASGAPQNLVGMGKVQSNDGLMTAFTGEAVGDTLLTLPYVPWGGLANDYRTYIAVMNTGATNITNLWIRYYYLDSGGAAQYNDVQLASASKPLKPYAKISTTPASAPGAIRDARDGFVAAEIGALDSGSIIPLDAAQPIVALARVQRAVSKVRGITTLGEDYSGIDISSLR